jgi:hypothetical protein
MILRRFGTFGPAVFGAVALLTLLLAIGCGSSSSSTSPSPTASASPPLSAAEAQIKANWEAFFSGMTPAARKIALLQNGQQFAKTIEAQASSAIAKSTQATVSAVKVISPKKASVTYSIQLNGQTALPDQQGQAVLVGKVWKVSAPSFAALLQLEQGGSSPSPSAMP